MIVDYLSFTFKSSNFYDNYLQGGHTPYNLCGQTWNYKLSLDYTEFCRSSLTSFLNCVNLAGDQASLGTHYSSSGMFGYSESFVIVDSDGKQLGKAAFGGNAGTMLISITGVGCRFFDLSKVEHFLNLAEAKITRIDLALDLYDGEYDIDYALDSYHNGGFQLYTNTVQPTARFIDDLGSGSGRTLYVGKVANGKSMRVYEKGKQLGDKESSWVRWELQLGSRDRVIPLDIFSNLKEYFVAAYPVLTLLFDDSEIDNDFDARIKLSKKSTTISFNSLLHYGSLAYGRLLNFMTLELCMTPSEVLDSFSRSGMPNRLGSNLGFSYVNYLKV